jgi:hypothetical protein
MTELNWLELMEETLSGYDFEEMNRTAIERKKLKNRKLNKLARHVSSAREIIEKESTFDASNLAESGLFALRADCELAALHTIEKRIEEERAHLRLDRRTTFNIKGHFLFQRVFKPRGKRPDYAARRIVKLIGSRDLKIREKQQKSLATSLAQHPIRFD